MPRARQEAFLEALLDGEETPSAIAVHGAPGTGKSHTIRKVLTERACEQLAWVRCDQCATARVLLQKALRQILLMTETGVPSDAVCENLNIFTEVLTAKKSLEHSRVVLVLDRIDTLPDRAADLLTGMARLPELAPEVAKNLTIILVYSTPEPRALLPSNVPHIWFPRFSAADAVAILTANEDICLVPDSSPLWSDIRREFIRIVADTLAPYTGTDISLLTKTTQRLWPEFIANEDPASGFPRIYGSKAHLFLSETNFLDSLENQISTKANMSSESMYLLISAYLASYNPPRYDVRFFSLAKDMRAKRRETKPRKTVELPPRTQAPPPFELERMLAIYAALINAHQGPRSNCIDEGAMLAQLTQQNLIVHSGRGSRDDPLDSRTKWKVNVSEGFVRTLAAKVGLPIDEYLM